MEKQTYRTEMEAYSHEMRFTPKEILEREFIFKFLDSLPTEKLKELISFEMIDPANKEHWRKYENQPILNRLASSDKVLFRGKIEL
jgi:hypothetical protein